MSLSRVVRGLVVFLVMSTVVGGYWFVGNTISDLYIGQKKLEAKVISNYSNMCYQVESLEIRSFRKNFIQNLLDQTVWLETSHLTGSGVILDSKKGIVLTCDHCLEFADDTIIIHTNNGGRFVIENPKLERYHDYDMAIIYTGVDLKAKSAKIRSSHCYIGEEIIVIGTPSSMTNSLSIGHISAKFRPIVPSHRVWYYQTDAAINNGNSGGPWFDERGYLVALSARKMTNKDNISFGVPLFFLEEARRKNAGNNK